MSEKIKDILNFKKNWIELSEIAIENGNITMEEYLLIRNFTANVEEYLGIYNRNFINGKILNTGSEELFRIRSRIMQEAIENANEGLSLDPTKFALLSKISELLEEVEKIEEKLAED